MGNESSTPASYSGDIARAGRSAGSPKAGGHDFVAGVQFPPMVLLINDAVWSHDALNGQRMAEQEVFCSVLVDGKEIGRVVKFPSQALQVRACDLTSVLVLRFFLGTDADVFLCQDVRWLHEACEVSTSTSKVMEMPQTSILTPAMSGGYPEPDVMMPGMSMATSVLSIRLLAELSMPLRQLVKYGAPLYTSLWLGLPSDELHLRGKDFPEALQNARNPEVSKVNITLFRPEYHSRANLSNPKPDVTSLLIDESPWDLCAPPAYPPLVSPADQVRGLVEALNLANSNSLALSSQGSSGSQNSLGRHVLKIHEEAAAAVRKSEESAAELDTTRKELESTRQELADTQIELEKQGEALQALQRCPPHDPFVIAEAEQKELKLQLEGSQDMQRKLLEQLSKASAEIASLRQAKDKDEELLRAESCWSTAPLAEDNKRLQESLSESEDKLRKEKMARTQAELQIVRAQQEFQTKFLDTGAEIKKLQKSLMQSEEQRHVLQSQLSSAESSNLQLPEQIKQDWEGKMMELDQQHQVELARPYAELEALREQANQWMEALVSAQQELEASKCSAAKELEASKCSAAKELEASKCSAAKERERLEFEILQIQKAHTELEASKDSAAKPMDGSSCEANQWIEALVSAQQELEACKSSAAKERSTFELKVLQMQKAHEELEARKVSADSERESLEFEILQMQRAHATFQREAAHASKELENLRVQAARKDEVENDLEQMMAEVESLRLHRTRSDAKEQVSQMSSSLWLRKVKDLRQELLAVCQPGSPSTPHSPTGSFRRQNSLGSTVSETWDAEQEFEMLQKELRKYLREREFEAERIAANMEKQFKTRQPERKEPRAESPKGTPASPGRFAEISAALIQEQEAHSNDVSSLHLLIESMKVDQVQCEQRVRELEVVLRSVYPDAPVLQEKSQSVVPSPVGSPTAGTPVSSSRSMSFFTDRAGRFRPVLASKSSRSLDGSDATPGGSTPPFTADLTGKAGTRSTVDKYVLRLFRRLLLERFSHLDPEELHRALKMDTRPSTMLRVDVDKVLKTYKAHQKNFGMRKAFQRLDVQRTGQLAASDFESRLAQVFSFDAGLSSHIHRLLLEQAGKDAGMISEEQFAQSLGEPRLAPRGS